MEAPFARTFTGYVAWMATNSPHATLLDWWRRLELALREYARSRGLPPRARHDRLEDAVSEDPHLGPEIAAKLRCLRQRRNAAAHGPQTSRGTKLSATPSVHSSSSASSEICLRIRPVVPSNGLQPTAAWATMNRGG